jgi:hypothetical protein
MDVVEALLPYRNATNIVKLGTRIHHKERKERGNIVQEGGALRLPVHRPA